MTIYSRVTDALRLADTLASWDESAFEWSKASIAAAFAEAAYYEIPEHEIKDVDNVKLIPCEGFQR